MKLFIFGLGYSATYIAQRLAARGAAITATVRSQAKADLLSGSGHAMRLFATAHRDETIAREIADSDAVIVPIGVGTPRRMTTKMASTKYRSPSIPPAYAIPSPHQRR